KLPCTRPLSVYGPPGNLLPGYGNSFGASGRTASGRRKIRLVFPVDFFSPTVYHDRSVQAEYMGQQLSWESASFATRRSAVRARSAPPTKTLDFKGFFICWGKDSLRRPSPPPDFGLFASACRGYDERERPL